MNFIQMLFPNVKWEKLLNATIETIIMSSVSLIFICLIGLLLGFVLYFTRDSKTKGQRIIYTLVSIFSNTFRSIPFMILILLLIPLSKLMFDTMIGVKAALPALIISAAPFYGRIVELAFREVDKGVIEAAKAMGANTWQIIYKVLIPESLPALISGLTVTAVTLIGFTAMAGVIGAGGLGTLAYTDGFHRNRQDIIIVATVAILILVFITQYIGDFFVKIADKR